MSHKTDNMFAQISNRVERLDEILKGMQTDFSSLNQMVSSHFMEIKSLEEQIGELTIQFNLKKEGKYSMSTNHHMVL